MPNLRGTAPAITIDTMTIAPIAKPKAGKNVTLAFHALKAAKGAQGADLPPSIAVMIGKQVYEAEDVTGAGTYVVQIHLPTPNVPPRPIVRPMGSGVSGGRPLPGKPHFIHCSTIRCWKGCKSILFGSKCRACIKCSFDV